MLFSSMPRHGRNGSPFDEAQPQEQDVASLALRAPAESCCSRSVVGHELPVIGKCFRHDNGQ